MIQIFEGGGDKYSTPPSVTIAPSWNHNIRYSAPFLFEGEVL